MNFISRLWKGTPPALASAGLLALGTAFAATPAAAVVVGNPLVNMALVGSSGNPGDIIIDGVTGLIPVAGRLTSWGFYDDDTPVNDLSAYLTTPMIFQKTEASAFKVVGIGTTRTSDNSGAQTFDFGLVSGTDVVQGNGTYYFGFRDGTADGSTIGYSAVDLTGPSPHATGLHQTFYTGIGSAPVAPGTTVPVYTNFDALYAYNATVSPVPLPPTLLLLLSASGSLIVLRRVRRNGRGNAVPG